LTATLRSSVAT